jgi:tripartite-type tricarboxylate transporter receptor subunit TctC
MGRALTLVAGLTLAVLASLGAATAQSQPFYAGKTLTITVGTSAGGYYDIAGRIVARHIGRFLAGQPATVVQNDPVAGGLGLGNRLAHTMPRDGTQIAVFNRALPQLALAGDRNAQFDPLAFTWLGSLSSYRDDAYLMVLRDTQPARSIADVDRQPRAVHLAGTRAGATNIVFALIAHDMLKMNVDLIRGFPGAAEIWLAMERGEIDGQISDISAIRVGRPQLWDKGLLHPIVAFGRTERLPAYPDIPIARELVKDPDDLALLEFAEMPFFMALPFAAPPGLPPDRAAELQEAFMKMAEDPSFRDDMLKAGIMTSPIDGAAVRALIARTSTTPQAIRDRFMKLLAD